MRTVLAFAALGFLALLPGCPVAGCGGYDGTNDVVYSRGNDSLILCENGGFVATVGTSSLEGKYIANTSAESGAAGFGVNGTDGQVAFDLYNNADGTASTPQLGDAPWQRLDLDETALDHADSLCQDLVNRPWWPTL